MDARPDILTTLPLLEPAWLARTAFVDRRRVARRELLRRVVADAPRFRAVVLDGVVGASERYVDLVAAAVVARTRRAPAVLLSEVNWKRGATQAEDVLRRLGLRVVDAPRVHFCVLSHDDRAALTRLWGVDPARVHVTPYSYTLFDEDLAAPVGDDGSVFAGGNSMRDYGPLLEALPAVHAPVTLATTKIAEADRARLPATVQAGPVRHDEFMERLRNASVVVVPLEQRDDRSAGQQTYLNAMTLGKLVVVTDAYAVREYVDDGRTGIVVPSGDGDALRRALTWALDPRNAADVARMRAAGQAEVRRRFEPRHYAQRILDVVDGLAAARA